MIVAIDFFCGAGGLTRGLLDAGVKVLAGVDNDERLRETYEKNNPPSRFFCKDIREVDIKALRKEVGVGEGDQVVYAACAPCQPFSTLNRAKGPDPRTDLLTVFGEIVKKSPPDFIVVENVPGLNTAYGRDVYAEFKALLAEAGFLDAYEEALDAKDFGVPQVRKRFIMLSSRHGTMEGPQRADEETCVEDAIKKYPAIEDGGESADYYNHVARALKPNHKVIVKAVPKDGGSRREVKDVSILLKCHQDNPTVHKDVFGRMWWKRPAPTLTGRCTDVYCGRFTHPQQDRGISLREAAAIQTFEDGYRFYGTFFFIAHQIGNAVPVKFARRLGDAIVKAAVAQTSAAPEGAPG